MTAVTAILQRAEAGARLSREEIARLLAAEGEDQAALFAAADRVRQRTMGDGVYLRGIIEFSNICRQDCLYCGIRRSNRKVKRYRMSPEEILATARAAERLGYGTVVLQSGESDALSPDEVATVVRAIKRETSLAVTLSLGERTYEEYALWKKAGADRYLLRHETADPVLFARLRPGRTLAERVQCLYHLRRLGYQVGSGFMVGLPGQTVESLAADIDLLVRLRVEMAGIGPFIPHPDTPLAGAEPGTLEMTLKAVAVTRLLIPDAHIPATTALGTIHPEGRQMGLRVGANVIMPSLTPPPYRARYLLYPGKICVLEDPEACAPCVQALILAQGRYVARGPGHSPRPAFAQSADKEEMPDACQPAGQLY